MNSPQTEIRKSLRFEAAHRLNGLPAGHKCARLHGHSYRATVVLRGVVDSKLGWFMDFGDLKEVMAPLIDRLDHRYLNEIPGLENPTAEVIARYIYENLLPLLPLLTQVILEETCTSECRYPA